VNVRSWKWWNGK